MENYLAVADISLGTVTHRLMTPQEIEADEINRATIISLDAQQAQAKAEAAAAKAALLEKLGITEEEAKLLLGGN